MLSGTSRARSSVLFALSPEDGAATLTAFTVAAIARSTEHMPVSPSRWVVTGGGRRKVACLDVDEFLSRLLEHVPPPNMQTVRGYGLYANSKRAELCVARQHFGQSAELPEVEPVTWRGRKKGGTRGRDSFWKRVASP